MTLNHARLPVPPPGQEIVAGDDNKSQPGLQVPANAFHDLFSTSRKAAEVN